MSKRILGISFSTRMVGLAVLESTTLIEYSVKFYKEKWSSAKMETILTSLTSAVKNYNISHIVLSIPPVYFHRKPLEEFWVEIVAHINTLRLPYTMYRLAALQYLIGSEERMTRKLLMEVLTGMYPELGFYAKIERRSKNKYYYKMFEAVAAATLYTQKGDTEIYTGEDSMM
jgi:hypothetical protein